MNYHRTASGRPRWGAAEQDAARILVEANGDDQ
jgi:hypothetical protein